MIFEELKKNLNIEILLRAKTHIGHRTFHPGMKKHLLVRNGEFYKHEGHYVIDTRKTLITLIQALDFLFQSASKNERILFVGTNPIISDLVQTYAEKSAQYYVVKKWQGGMLTNFKVVKESLFEIKKIEKILQKGVCKNKEEIYLKKKLTKKLRYLNGIRDMGGVPHVVLIFNVDESGIKAIQEARRLNIIVIAIVDTNVNPEGIDFLIPSSDGVAVEFFLKLFSNSIISGLKNAFKKNDELENKSKNTLQEEKKNKKINNVVDKEVVK